MKQTIEIIMDSGPKLIKARLEEFTKKGFYIKEFHPLNKTTFLVILEK